MILAAAWYQPNGSGDWATWVQSTGTVLAFLAVAWGLRQERRARRRAGRSEQKAVCIELLDAATAFAMRLDTNRTYWSGWRKIFGFGETKTA